MQAFEVHWLQWLFVGLLIGLTMAAFIYLGFFLPNLPGRPAAKEAEREQFPAGIEVARRGIPPVLLLLFLIFFTFFIAYLAYVIIYPVNF